MYQHDVESKTEFKKKEVWGMNIANREGAKIASGKRQAYYQPQVSTGKRRSLSVLAPLSLTSQVRDQWIFTGSTPEWSDLEEPAEKVTGDLPVIT